MAVNTTQLPTTPYQSVNAGVIPADVYGISINWFVNRAPLYTRLPHVPVGSQSFKITNDDYKPRSTTLASDYTAGGSSLTVTDGTLFDVGDVIQIDSEYLLVTAVSGSTLTVTKGYAGTTNANHTASGNTIYFITNTRTGAEVDIAAQSRIPTTVDQYCQTIQKAYSVGGSLNSTANYVGAFGSGRGAPLQRDKMMAVQHSIDEFEGACYYGKGVSLAGDTTRPAMKGLRSLISTNLTTSPSDASAYKPVSLIRDTVEKCWSAGGEPGLLVVSTNFMSGLATWGQNVQRLDAGATVFGTPIETFAVSFLPNIPIWVAPMLRSGTAICLSTDEIRIRIKRSLFEKPRGSRGDADEGDFIMEGAIELDNEKHHAWVEGITTFSA